MFLKSSISCTNLFCLVLFCFCLNSYIDDFFSSNFIFSLPVHGMISSELNARTSRARLESRLSEFQIGLFVQNALLYEFNALL